MEDTVNTRKVEKLGMSAGVLELTRVIGNSSSYPSLVLVLSSTYYMYLYFFVFYR